MFYTRKCYVLYQEVLRFLLGSVMFHAKNICAVSLTNIRVFISIVSKTVWCYMNQYLLSVRCYMNHNVPLKLRSDVPSVGSKKYLLTNLVFTSHFKSIKKCFREIIQQQPLLVHVQFLKDWESRTDYAQPAVIGIFSIMITPDVDYFFV